jgi:phage shock protein E
MHRWLIIALTLGITAGCGGEAPGADPNQESAPAAEAPRGEGTAATTAQERDVVYVDVRSPEEFAAGHVENAINIPHTEMRERYSELESFRDDAIVVYCRSGRRSGIALDVLEDVGFENVRNGGGLSDLQRQGVPVTR